MKISGYLLASLLILIFILIPRISFSQEDLLNVLEEEQPEDEVNVINNTFKGTRIINGHSIEVRDKNSLIFLITHRFGRINTGIYEFFGIDNANIRLGLDYGISDRLTVGIGRSSFEKVFDGFIKYQVLKQTSGAKTMPITLTLFGSVAVKTLRSPDLDVPIPLERKLAYTSQALIARKFSDNLSLQLMPTLVHRNYVDDFKDDNTIFALGVGGRYKFSNRIGLTAEYYHRFYGLDAENISNSLSFGLDIETGGHVFQIMVTNSRQMNEKGFITETDGQWGDGDIHFGFNISRIFFLGSVRE